MQARHFALTIFALLAGVLSALAQGNTLSIPDVSVAQGRSIDLPVNLDNSEDVVAVQFTLYVPEGISLDAATAALTDRSDGHSVTMKQMAANKYMAMVFSPTNKPLKGRTGSLLSVGLTADERLGDDSQLRFVLEDVVISARDGSNVATGFSAGSITISRSADLKVSAVVADASAVSPGDRLNVAWRVRNIGQAATTAGWSEQIYLASPGGESKLAGTVYYDGTLAAGGTLSRQAEIGIPEQPGISGEATVRVKLVPASDTGEPSWMLANNEASAASALTVSRKLLLSPDTIRTEETARSLRLLLTRTGSRLAEETFAIGCTADERVSVPPSATIRAGQSGTYITVTVTPNGKADADSTVRLTAGGNGYDDVAGIIVIEDDRRPALTLAASAPDVTEGGTLSLTVSAPKAVTKDTEIIIACDKPAMFSIPSPVIIKQGEASATATVGAIDNDIPDVEQVVTFTAAAPGYDAATLNTTLIDNDVPMLQMQLEPTAVSEADGPLAVTATLRRTSNIDKRVTIHFSDDSEGGLYYAGRSVVMEPGQAEATICLGPIDNTDADGERTYSVSAGVYIASCSCSAGAGASAGVATAPLTVYDDDGPALSLSASASVVAEGGTMAVTVGRNTVTDKPLTVSLASDHSEGISFPKSVEIPAGAASATFDIVAEANAVAGDGFVGALQASADGFSGATLRFVVTDRTLPDAQITAIEVSPAEASAGDTVSVALTIANTGVRPLPVHTRIDIFAGEGLSPALSAYLQSPIEAGGHAMLTRKVRLPDGVGRHNVYAVANPDRAVDEAIYTNNTSQPAEVNVCAPFSATVSTDKKVYGRGETVVISGRTEGGKTGQKQVEVYVVNNGYRHTINATTADDGTFSVQFTPFDLQTGRFSVGACYPGEGLTDAQCAFDVNGMRLSSSGYVTAEVTLGVPHSGTIGIDNPGSTTLTGVKAEVTGKPEGCDVKLECGESVDGGGTMSLGYTITGNAVSEGNEWEKIGIRVSSADCEPLETTIYYYCRSPKGKLQASTKSITTTMTKGQTRDYPVTITNIGSGNTGDISLALPSGGWMTAATPMQMPALAPGESATIHLLLEPTDGQQLNVPVTGRIGINCTNGDGLPVAFSITPVSEATGTLVVDVCDEWTYNTAEAPHVAGAEVVIKDVNTGAVIANGTTGTDGIFTKVLPEGYYNLCVTADKHDAYSNNIMVDPGVETRKVVDISYRAIEVSYELVETEIEDEYIIENIVKFETNVPKPVVVIEGPNSIDGDNMAAGDQRLVYFTLTNHGLVRTENVRFNLPTPTDEWLFEALADTGPFPLGANQSVQIPVLITRYPNGGQRARDKRRASPQKIMNGCMAQMEANYEIICGTKLYDNVSAHRMAMKACATSAILNAIGQAFGGSGSWGGLGGPNGSGGGNADAVETTRPVESNNDKTICDPCYAELLENNLNDLFDMIPVVGWVNDGATLAYDCARAKAENRPYSLRDSVLAKIRDYAIEGFGDAYGAYKDYNTPPGEYDDLIETVEGMLENIDNINKHLDEYKKCKARQAQQGGPKRSRQDGGLPTTAQPADGNASGNSWIDALADAAADFREELEAWKAVKLELFGDSVWYTSPDPTIAAFWQQAIDQHVEGQPLDAEALMPYKPESVTEAQLRALVERLNGTSAGNAPDTEVLMASARLIKDSEAMAIGEGFQSMQDRFFKASHEFLGRTEEESSSVCSSITLRFEQRMTFTRQAFRGTLTVFNGNEDMPMRDVKLTLRVNNTEGDIATANEFQVGLESIDGFNGKAELGAGWELAPGATGKATILYIPTKHAAPTEPTDYVFSGSLSYTDPYNGLTATREIYPVTLTVNPTPDLKLTYFMQRDVYGDDPLTEAVEPSEEAEFALLIDNVGNGDATNLRIVTKQPEIIDNEKGLAIDFQLTGSSLNGADKVMALGGDAYTDFGTIKSKGQAYAQWWITSSLLGHFTEYDVKATHATSYGNPNLSLLNEVTVHELIRSIDASAENDTITGFMTNDIADADDTPDMLYLTDGTTEQVEPAAGATITQTSETTYELAVTPSAGGWNYGNLVDPTYGRARLRGVTRTNDGKPMSLRNFWQTDRTLRDGLEPLYENRIHFADNFNSGVPCTYELTFEPQADLPLEVASIEGVPTEVAFKPVETIDVMFNKHIDPSTFTADDITMSVQGESLDASLIGISTEDNKTFRLNLGRLNAVAGNGYYMLTVQTAMITDAEGYQGTTGKSAGWTMFRDGLVSIDTEVSPARAGKIVLTTSPATAAANATATQENGGKAGYGTTVAMKAIPGQGYKFVNWTLNGETVTSDSVIEHTATDNIDVVANFKAAAYHVTVASDEGGSVTGSGSGIYDYGDTLKLEAVADEDYMLWCWTVNGDTIEAKDWLTIEVNGKSDIAAHFKRATYRQTFRLFEGWNWLSSYLGESIDAGNFKYASTILGHDGKSILPDGPDDGEEKHALEPGHGYKMEAAVPFVANASGKLHDLAEQPIAVAAGWNWISCPLDKESPLAAITNATEGDFITAQEGFAEFADGRWIGTIATLVPGNGYLYKSVDAKALAIDTCRLSATPATVVADERIDMRKYPSTMNITAIIYRNEAVLDGDDWRIVAFAGNECRGVSRMVGGRHCLTVYGNGAEPEPLSFVVENTSTGDGYSVDESLAFTDDVAGSRKSPLAFTMGEWLSIDEMLADGLKLKVYTIAGTLVTNEGTRETLKRLPRGVYIIEGRKYIVR